MQDLRKALADIGDIRLQLAAGTMFRGFGPAVVALSGLLALTLAAAQTVWLVETSRDPTWFLALWIGLAGVATLLIGLEMRARTRRQHGGLADAMLFNAAEHFIPVGAAGACLAAVFLQFAPDLLWLLPGLWQVLIGIGLFAALRFLPRAVSLAAAFYFVAGLGVIMATSEARTLEPWAMGLPFGLGQLLLAAILRLAYGGEEIEQ